MTGNKQTSGSTDAAPRRRDPRREKTEARIIEAFGRIVARDGLYQVRVNKLMREAGVGKKQLYQYFGDLAGVARAWSNAGMQSPKAPRAPVARHPTAGSPAMQLSDLLQDYADELHRNPAALASLHAQLGGPAELSEPLAQVQAALMRQQTDFFLRHPFLRKDEYIALYSVLYAAINYLALRAKFSPLFNGLDLSREDGWEAALGMVETVAALTQQGVASGPRARQARPKGATASEPAGTDQAPRRRAAQVRRPASSRTQRRVKRT